MRILNSVAAIVLALGVEFPSLTGAQPRQPAPWNITFFGRVEAVNSESKVVTVKHGAIAGYMDSATTEFSTKEGALLIQLHPGDDIRATVHPNDLTLYHIQIVYSDGAKRKSSK
jgi:Cu/Ag efflux protein CusF